LKNVDLNIAKSIYSVVILFDKKMEQGNLSNPLNALSISESETTSE